MKTVEFLNPNDSHKSFYGKAIMIHSAINPITELQSYDTIVADYNHATNKMRVFGWYSNTTARHIRAFLSHFGFDTATKKQMENWDNN